MNHSAGSRPPREHKLRVLLVDDQVISGEYLKRSLASLPDLEFKHCLDPAQAVQTANQFNPTVILKDLGMPDIDGLMLVKFFRANPATRDTPMIVLSGKEENLAVAAVSPLEGRYDTAWGYGGGYGGGFHVADVFTLFIPPKDDLQVGVVPDHLHE